jgi:hypothetical protein
VDLTGVSSRFRCPRPADFEVRAWPDGVAVYDDGTGDVRALTPAAGEVFAQLLSQPPISPADLSERLLGEPPTPQDLEQMLALLTEFESMGLAQRVSG